MSDEIYPEADAMLKQLVAGGVVAVMLTGAAMAGPFEDALAAYERSDYAEAVKWFRLAADQGDVQAQFKLGVMYGDGRGVAQDHAEAVKWFRLAADQGDAGAQINLGLIYSIGRGVAQDHAEAVKWYRLAADQGHASAQHNLGSIYFAGLGVAQDYVLAHMWFNLAASQGLEHAFKARHRVAGLMTPDQMAEAQRLAREWKPSAER
jgi:hypothetical protein